MDSYTEVTFTIDPVEPWRDVLVADLGELGFDSFSETEDGVRAYIPTTRFDHAAVIALAHAQQGRAQVRHTHTELAPRNWNAEWEAGFDPVEVDDQVRIRAEFHAPSTNFAHELVITPRMAFGTGHHATTRMMVKAMLGLQLADKHVCDLGCGTAVLAMLAERQGARTVTAIDIDVQAVLNARENIALNRCSRIVVKKGDVALLEPASCGAILANIERNTLLRDMQAMRDALQPDGALLLSGFLRGDVPRMVRAVEEVGLRPEEHLEDGEWALIGCRR